ncbi:hypothetical protein [Bradyrhizobium monzae]|uniref:hypothetical protein n=1 Tax=Bradyrhizobium sp. Oc8 TaxID=2876780 RepID=UPI001F2FFDB7|nr:hypothetical protein [Bradyrhizobium sp. Oc8]
MVYLPVKKAKDGAIVFVFKSPKKQPELVDAKGNALGQGIIIRGGSLIRITGVMALWEKGGIRAVSLWPDAVRADSDRCRPGFRDDLAHHSDLKSPTRSEMMSPAIPG